MFDDSLVHTAEYPVNDESEIRAVLVIDLWHHMRMHLCKSDEG